MRKAVMLVLVTLVMAGCAEPIPDDGPQGDGIDDTAPDGVGGGGGAIAGGEGGSAGGGIDGTGTNAPPAGSAPPGGATGGPPSGGAPPTGGGAGGGGGGSTGSTGTGSTSSGGTGVSWDIPQSVHQSAWLCQTAVSVNDLNSQGTDGQQCLVSLAFSSTTLTVTTNGIPNHNYNSGAGCCTTTQSASYTFPLHAELATTPTFPSQRGAQATAVNGVAIFGPEDSNGVDVVIHTYTQTGEPRLSTCDAHSEPQSGVYHYHADGNCIHYHGSMADYSFDKVDSTAHSGIIGWVPDGFPIYGSYGYAADGVTLKQMVSSYQFKAGADYTDGQEGQEYVEGLGDLDECNGHTGPTPEFPTGIYHYHSTKSGGGGDLGFPYFPLCYSGVISSGGTGGGTGGGGAGGGMSSGSMTGTQTGAPPGGGGGGGGGGQCPPPNMPPPPGGCPP